jgi:PPM family protein phosphatase
VSAIVASAVTDVGKVREHNEDAYFIDAELGVFIICDGMGGHAAGEVASAMAVQEVRKRWTSDEVDHAITVWKQSPSPESRRNLTLVLQRAVGEAHKAILAEAKRDPTKHGMGTTIVAFRVVDDNAFFAHAGDSRGYLVRDGIAMQVTEDHTLLAKLLAAGIDIDTSGDGSRFRSMLTNALGVGVDCKVSTFVVPLADGDRFLLCSDGVSEYLPEREIGEILTQQPSPARAAQRLIELALARGGADNATAIVVRVLESGIGGATAAMRDADVAALAACSLFAGMNAQQRLRATRICLEREFGVQEVMPAIALNDRVAWVLLGGEVEWEDSLLRSGALLYPTMLTPNPDALVRAELATVTQGVRAMAIRADDFRELCDDDVDIGERLQVALLDTIGGSGYERAVTREISRNRLETDGEITDVRQIYRSSSSGAIPLEVDDDPVAPPPAPASMMDLVSFPRANSEGSIVIEIEADAADESDHDDAASLDFDINLTAQHNADFNDSRTTLDTATVGEDPEDDDERQTAIVQSSTIKRDPTL